jgi:hypothetical protein
MTYADLESLYAEQRAAAGVPLAGGGSRVTPSASSAVLQGVAYNPATASRTSGVGGGGLAGGLGLSTEYRMPYSQLDRAALDQRAAVEQAQRAQQMRLATEQASRALGAAPSVASTQLRYGLADAGQVAAQQAASVGGANRGLGAVGGAQQYGAGMMQAQAQGVEDRMAELQAALGQAGAAREADLATLQQRLRAAQSDQEAYLTAVEADRDMRQRNKDADDAAWAAMLQTGGALAGGAAGMMLGGPAGGVAGMAMGGAAGKAASGL